jgi:hypothetical protein
MVQLRATLPTAAHVPATLSALYIVMERMDVDMAKTIEVTSKMELLTQSWLIYQMISALKNLHAGMTSSLKCHYRSMSRNPALLSMNHIKEIFLQEKAA